MFFYSLILVNFGLMINCFVPVRSEQNIIGSVGLGSGPYSVRSWSGQKITGHFEVGCQKPCPTGLYYTLIPKWKMSTLQALILHCICWAVCCIVDMSIIMWMQQSCSCILVVLHEMPFCVQIAFVFFFIVVRCRVSFTKNRITLISDLN